jgi:hypothetical protein
VSSISTLIRPIGPILWKSKSRNASGSRAFPMKTESRETLYLFVLTQFRTRNRFPLSLELL